MTYTWRWMSNIQKGLVIRECTSIQYMFELNTCVCILFFLYNYCYCMRSSLFFYHTCTCICSVQKTPLLSIPDAFRHASLWERLWLFQILFRWRVWRSGFVEKTGKRGGLQNHVTPNKSRPQMGCDRTLPEWKNGLCFPL